MEKKKNLRKKFCAVTTREYASPIFHNVILNSKSKELTFFAVVLSRLMRA